MAKKKEIKPLTNGALLLIGIGIGIVIALICYFGYILGEAASDREKIKIVEVCDK